LATPRHLLDNFLPFSQEPSMTLQSDNPIQISETNASGGIKLGSVRYVLGISLALCLVAGVIIWNMFAK
jgi:hypothetical protein